MTTSHLLALLAIVGFGLAAAPRLTLAALTLPAALLIVLLINEHRPLAEPQLAFSDRWNITAEHRPWDDYR